MPTTTPAQALPIPVLADIANVPLHVQNLTQALEVKLVMVFASAAARTAAIPSPTAGMLCWRSDASAFEYYTGSAWTQLFGFGPRTQYSSQNSTIVSGSNNTTGTVTFATAYAVAPNVIATVNAGATAGRFGVKLAGVTTTNFSYNVFTTDGVNVGSNANIAFFWLATL